MVVRRLGQCLAMAALAALCAAGERAQAPPSDAPDAKQDPPPMVCRNLTKGNVVASRLVIADTFETRRKGFLGRTTIEPGEGMLLVPCWAIHMVGMKFPLDIVFLDREMRVVDVAVNVKPGVVNRSCRKAHSTLELPAGTVAAKRVEKGDTLQVIRADEAEAKGAQK